MSPVAGTVVEHLAAIEANVLVGTPLFTVDDSRPPSDSKATQLTAVTPAPSPATVPPHVDAPVPALTNPPTHRPAGHRTPLIKFLGKRSLLPQPPIPKHASELVAAPARPAAPVVPSSPGVLPFNHVKRVPLSPAEVDAINSGISFL